ncbi:MAG: RidA family protein [Gemmatimonadota bacterium]|nr:MAG: RidA family protein [Gemmatimonadota bacterium]
MPFMRTLALAPILLVSCAAPDTVSDRVGSEMEVAYLTTSGPEELDLPFSEAVQIGDLMILSGQVGVLPGTPTLVEGGIQPETRQAMENIKSVLERHGSSMERVVKCTVMLEDIDEWGEMNEVYREYFPGLKPARSAFGADGLALGAQVEIECWAIAG